MALVQLDLTFTIDLSMNQLAKKVKGEQLWEALDKLEQIHCLLLIRNSSGSAYLFTSRTQMHFLTGQGGNLKRAWGHGKEEKRRGQS